MFLSVLFNPTVGLVEFRALPSKARTFVRYDTLVDTTAFLSEHCHQNLYFGVASRRDASNGRLENCEALGALYADIDYKMSSPDAARERLARFALPPTMRVVTGGGVHVYWRLREWIDLQNPTPAKALLRRLAHSVGGDLSAAEPARILRVPGTLNHKYRPARLVTIETFEPSRQYLVSEFDRVLPAEPPTTTAGIDMFAKGEHIVEGQRNAMLYSIARSLRARRLTYEAIAAVVDTVNSQLCVPPLDANEVKAIIASATTQPDRADFASKHRLVRNRPSRVQVTVTLT
jgi:hypothetical protein